MKIGAHVSVSGGLEKAVARGLRIGAYCLQIFSSPPVQWQSSTYSDTEITKFKKLVHQHKLNPVFIHAPYLVNLATKNPYTHKKSINALKSDLDFSDSINAVGVIFHIGSHKDISKKQGVIQVVDAIQRILDRNNNSLLLLENAAGEQNKIGNKFEDLSFILKALDHPHLAYCFDTAHAYSAGYDISSKNSVNKTIKKLEKTVGLDKLLLIHANDTKTKLGGGRDKHENIGEGNIGLRGFKALLNHPKLMHLPFIIETPGFKHKGPDRRNIHILKSLGNN